MESALKFINELVEGERVESVFAVTEKQLRELHLQIKYPPKG